MNAKRKCFFSIMIALLVFSSGAVSGCGSDADSDGGGNGGSSDAFAKQAEKHGKHWRIVLSGDQNIRTYDIPGAAENHAKLQRRDMKRISLVGKNIGLVELPDVNNELDIELNIYQKDGANAVEPGTYQGEEVELVLRIHDNHIFGPIESAGGTSVENEKYTSWAEGTEVKVVIEEYKESPFPDGVRVNLTVKGTFSGTLKSHCPSSSDESDPCEERDLQVEGAFKF